MITLIDEKDKKSGRAPNRPYGHYSMVISEHIPWLKEQVSKSKYGYIYIRKNDIEDTLGLRIINFDALLWALKYVLFENGLIIEKAHLRDGTRIFSIRFGTEEDVLPETLRKKLNKEYI